MSTTVSGPFPWIRLPAVWASIRILTPGFVQKSMFRPSGSRISNGRCGREGALPPVRLYQIRDDYFVLDGNHRVAAAKELGWTEIQAKVVELLSGQNSMENLIYLEKKEVS